jgi:hypothetical protein
LAPRKQPEQLEPEQAIGSEESLEPKEASEPEPTAAPEPELLEPAIGSEEALEPKEASEPELTAAPEPEQLEPEQAIGSEESLEPKEASEPEPTAAPEPLLGPEPEQTLGSEESLEPKEASEPELTAAPEPLLGPEEAVKPDELPPEPAAGPDADYEAWNTDAITTVGENTERGTAVIAPGVTDIEAGALAPALQTSRANTNEGAQDSSGELLPVTTALEGEALDAHPEVRVDSGTRQACH